MSTDQPPNADDDTQPPDTPEGPDPASAEGDDSTIPAKERLRDYLAKKFGGGAAEGAGQRLGDWAVGKILGWLPRTKQNGPPGGGPLEPAESS
ncbi:hypothetical protein [Streptomyces sp. NPDC085665]|uniref:hypothetical protein n=1 Tax=Streptomyces sp. NPDC085665 TaxID=3365735 RepID=UPI0037D4A16C